MMIVLAGHCACLRRCPLLTADGFSYSCGSPAFFCPNASSQPQAVAAGYYTVGGTETTRSAQEPCLPGYACNGFGLAEECSPGTYSLGGKTAVACRQCEPGTASNE